MKNRMLLNQKGMYKNEKIKIIMSCIIGLLLAAGYFVCVFYILFFYIQLFDLVLY